MQAKMSLARALCKPIRNALLLLYSAPRLKFVKSIYLATETRINASDGESLTKYPINFFKTKEVNGKDFRQGNKPTASCFI